MDVFVQQRTRRSKGEIGLGRGGRCRSRGGQGLASFLNSQSDDPCKRVCSSDVHAAAVTAAVQQNEQDKQGQQRATGVDGGRLKWIKGRIVLDMQVDQDGRSRDGTAPPLLVLAVAIGPTRHPLKWPGAWQVMCWAVPC